MRKTNRWYRIQAMAASLILLATAMACTPSQRSSQQNVDTPAQAQTKNVAVAEAPMIDTLGLPAPAAEIVSSAPLLNPAHGLPGHICEIPVGSPLPAGHDMTAPSRATFLEGASAQASAAAQRPVNTSLSPTIENAQRLNPSQVYQPSQQQSTEIGEKPELNPPHGQAWHRCDIPVGSPLP